MLYEVVLSDKSIFFHKYTIHKGKVCSVTNRAHVTVASGKSEKISPSLPSFATQLPLEEYFLHVNGRLQRFQVIDIRPEQ